VKSRLILPAAVISFAAGLVIACSGPSATTSAQPPTSSTTTTQPRTNTSAPPPTTSSTASSVSFSKDIQPIFNANCVVCHTGTSGPVGLSLDPGSSYKNIVNVNSTEAPALKRIAPGYPDKSYLLDKVLGTQTQAGGSGAQMPFGASPLPQSQIGLIRQWVSQGAPNN